MPRYTFFLPDALAAEIESRTTGDGRETGHAGRSTIAQQMLASYLEILRQARRDLRARLAPNEIALILDTLNGTLFDEPALAGALWQEVADGIALNGLAEKWSIDGPALVETVRALPLSHCLALVEASQRFWRAVSAGKDLTIETALNY